MSKTLESPYSNISDWLWAEAYDHACERIWDREESEREPSFEEIDAVLENLMERWRIA